MSELADWIRRKGNALSGTLPETLPDLKRPVHEGARVRNPVGGKGVGDVAEFLLPTEPYEIPLMLAGPGGKLTKPALAAAAALYAGDAEAGKGKLAAKLLRSAAKASEKPADDIARYVKPQGYSGSIDESFVRVSKASSKSTPTETLRDAIAQAWKKAEPDTPERAAATAYRDAVKAEAKATEPVAPELARFGSKHEREAAIAEKVAAESAPAVINAKKAERTAVNPRKYRELYENEGTDAVLRAARRGEHLRPDGQGGYIGAPRHVTGGSSLGAMRRSLDQQFAEGADALAYAEGRYGDPSRVGSWYQRAQDAQARSSLPHQLDRNLDQTAVYSAGVSPESELAFSLKHGNSRALGESGRAYRSAGMDTLDESLIENRLPEFGDKIGEYRVKNDPRVRDTGPFGVNDFRAAQGFGYTDPSGAPWRAGVSATMHPFMDAETALTMGRANARGVGGKSDWVGPQLQEVPWVYMKGQDLYRASGAGGVFNPKNWPGGADEAMSRALIDANNTIGDYFPKHNFAGTYEYVPGANTNHRADILRAGFGDKVRYGKEGRWDVENVRGPDDVPALGTRETSRLNEALRSPPLRQEASNYLKGLPDEVGAGRRDAIYDAIGLRSLPSTKSVGNYRNSAGEIEHNPMTMANVLADFSTGSVGGINPSTMATLRASEGWRALLDAQEAGAGHLPVTSAGRTGKTDLLLDTGGRQVTPSQMRAVSDILRDTGVDATASPRGLMLMNFGDTPPHRLEKTLGDRLRAAVPDARIESAARESVYEPGLGKFGEDFSIVPTEPFSGEATAQALRRFAEAPPEAARRIGESEDVRRIIGQKIERDAGHPLTREDLQNTRKFFRDADWPKAVELMRKGMTPAAALAALGYSITSMAGEDPQSPPPPR